MVDEDNDLIKIVASLRASLDKYDGCTEEDCGCPGSILYKAVLECEKQYKEIINGNTTKSTLNDNAS